MLKILIQTNLASRFVWVSLYPKIGAQWLKILIGLIFIYNLTACSMKPAIQSIKISNSQDIYSYITQQFQVTTSKQQQATANYFAHYFSPWDKHHFSENVAAIKHEDKHKINNLMHVHGFSANMHHHTDQWAKQIASNADLKHFPNMRHRAITIVDTAAHEAPTAGPIFAHPHADTQPPPFDTNQQSLIEANTPVFILHISQDHAWYFVTTPSFAGWVPTKNVALVDANFAQQWQHKNFITPLKDNVAILDANNNVLLKTRIGEIYPLYQNTTDAYQILLAGSDPQHHAIVKIGILPKKTATTFPISLTTNNLADMINGMLGKPYGWGGSHGYRDCSSTMMDLFAPFGIWLPRNSGQQIKGLEYISLAGLNDAAKIKIIRTQGIPFLTLLHAPGHIVLYLGEHDGESFVFHDTWNALHDSIIGKTVITSIWLQRTDDATLIDQIDAMRVLLPHDTIIFTK